MKEIRSFRKKTQWFCKTKGLILQISEETGYSSPSIIQLRETKVEVEGECYRLIQQCWKEVVKYLCNEFRETGQEEAATTYVALLNKQQELLLTHVHKK